MKSCSKSTAGKRGKIRWLVARWDGGGGVPLVQVVLSGFWVVSDGFCWLKVISVVLKWFAVLVVTPISEHTEELTLYCTDGHTGMTETIRFFYLKKDIWVIRLKLF